MIGKTIQHYNILKQIDSGGMIDVYLAKHSTLKKYFVVKQFLLPESYNEASFRKRFLSETRAQFALEHPNIVKSYDLFNKDNIFFLIQEYVEGTSLNKILSQKEMPDIKESLRLFKGILKGLNYSHMKGFIHGDLKPSSILIDSNHKQAKVSNFSTKIVISTNKRLTSTATISGNALYMSPEQILRPNQIDHRTDVYSAGIILFEMLTGTTPFDGETEFTIHNKHISSSVPDLIHINPKIPIELARIVEKSLEKNADDRYSGCGEFLKYIEALESIPQYFDTDANTSQKNVDCVMKSDEKFCSANKEKKYTSLANNSILKHLLFLLPTSISIFFLSYVLTNPSSFNDNLIQFCKILIAPLTLIMIYSILMFVNKRKNTNEISKSFFEKTGFEKIESISDKILYLHSKNSLAPCIAVNWNEDDDVSNVFDTLKKEIVYFDKKIILYFIYTKTKPSPLLLQTLREDLKCEVIPIYLYRIEKVLRNQSSETIIKELNELHDLYITRIDPYFESNPIKDSSWFYGRDKLLEKIPSFLLQGQHVGIFGLRKVGKTSLIKQIQARFIKLPTAIIDCQELQTDALTYLNEILIQIKAELSALIVKKISKCKTIQNINDFRAQLLYLYDRWTSSGNTEPFVIILDEIDKFFSPNKFNNSQLLNEYINCFRILRGIAQAHDALVLLVVAYRPDINRINVIKTDIDENPMFQSFYEQYIGYLDAFESEQMIEEIGLWKNILWEENAAKKIFYYCGGHPYVSRYFASEVCEEGIIKQISCDKVDATAKIIQDTFHKNLIGTYYLEGIWKLIREDEKKVLTMICNNNKLTIKQIPKELRQSLSNLENLGLVMNQNNALTIPAYLFYKWLKGVVS